MVVVAHHESTSRLGAAVRRAWAPRDTVTLHTIDIRSSAPGENVEALAVLAAHGTYSHLGRSEGGVVRGLHSADPLLADVLAERLGRAAGLRLFT